MAMRKELEPLYKMIDGLKAAMLTTEVVPVRPRPER